MTKISEDELRAMIDEAMEDMKTSYGSRKDMIQKTNELKEEIKVLKKELETLKNESTR